MYCDDGSDYSSESASENDSEDDIYNNGVPMSNFKVAGDNEENSAEHRNSKVLERIKRIEQIEKSYSHVFTPLMIMEKKLSEDNSPKVVITLASITRTS